MNQVLGKIDRAIYRAEQLVAGFLFLVMAFLMFASVVHRVFSREEGRVSGLLLSLARGVGTQADPVFVHGPVSTTVNCTIAFALAYAALRTMKREAPLSAGKAAGVALAITAVLALAVKGVLMTLPNGLVWGPVVSLACMLWVGFLGGSIATYEKRHLALEMGDKIWPSRMLPYVRAVAMTASAGFCGFLLALSVVSLRDHHEGWLVNHLAGNLLPTEIPKWLVFLIFPYTFSIMGLRFLGAAAGALRGEPTVVESIPAAHSAEASS